MITITIDNYFYLLLLWKIIKYIIKWKIINLKKLVLKDEHGTCYHFDDIINLEDFDFNNILTSRKSHENTLIYDSSYKTLVAPNPLPIMFDKSISIY